MKSTSSSGISVSSAVFGRVEIARLRMTVNGAGHPATRRETKMASGRR